MLTYFEFENIIFYMEIKPIMNQNEVAQYLGISVSLLKALNKEGKGPKPRDEFSYKRKLWCGQDVYDYAKGKGESPTVHN